MNYHLMFDDKFLDNFIDDADAVAPGKNRYIFTFAPPAKIVKSTRGIFAPYHSEIFKQELGSLKEDDRLYIHWFDERLADIINKLPAALKIYYFFWGGDLIEQSPEFFEFNYEKLTKNYIENDKGFNKKYFFENPISFYKNLKLRIKNKTQKRTELLQKKEHRVKFLERLDFFCHWSKFDFENVIDTYGGNSSYRFFFYDAGINAIDEYIIPPQVTGRPLNILLGNSSFETNNHLDAIKVLKRFEKYNITVTAPLNYGNSGYAEMIEKAGIEALRSKWVSLLDFMPLNDYLSFLNKTDVIVMYHNRTQAAGNIFCLIKMGKKVYLKKKSSIYKLLIDYGVFVFEAETIAYISFAEFSKPLTLTQVEYNFQKIVEIFSSERRLTALTHILN